MMMPRIVSLSDISVTAFRSISEINTACDTDEMGEGGYGWMLSLAMFALTRGQRHRWETSLARNPGISKRTRAS